jgi:hypothetical protein
MRYPKELYPVRLDYIDTITGDIVIKYTTPDEKPLIQHSKDCHENLQTYRHLGVR